MPYLKVDQENVDTFIERSEVRRSEARSLRKNEQIATLEEKEGAAAIPE